VRLPAAAIILVLAAERVPAQSFTAAFLPDEFVARGAEWKFLRGKAAPDGGALDWTRVGFNDGAWETGRAGFGYDDGDDATLLSDMQGSYSTVYLRKRFEVADPSAVDDLSLVIDYDDGFIAFLNGREIARSNAGAAGSYPGFRGLAASSHDAGARRRSPSAIPPRSSPPARTCSPSWA